MLDRDVAWVSIHKMYTYHDDDNPVIVHKSTVDSIGFDSCVALQIGIIIDLRWLVG